MMARPRARAGESFSGAGLAVALLVTLTAMGCKKSESPSHPEISANTAPKPAPAPSAPAAQINPSLPFDGMIKSSQPLAYLRLESTSGASEIGNAQYQSSGGVSTVDACAPIDVPANHCALFNGKDGWMTTTLMGGIGKAGSIMAWIKLAALPSDDQRTLYVAGESENGNDFDLQLEPDNNIHFYTESGDQVYFAPDPKTLVNQWHMVVATLDTTTQQKALYWDGKPAANDNNGGRPNKNNQFTIGESSVFRGRYFDGAIDEVAVWDRALTPQDVAALYKPKAPQP